MKCSVCGSEILDGQSFCSSCGSPVPSEPQQVTETAPQQVAGGVAPQQMAGGVAPQQMMGGVAPQQMAGGVAPQQMMGGVAPQQMMGGYQQPMGGYQQPMGGYQQPMGGYQQPMGGYQQPMGGYPQQRPMGNAANGISAYFRSLTSNVMNIVKLVAALFMFIAPLLPWVSVKLFGMKESGNMFKLGGFHIFAALLIMLISLILIVWDMADYVPALGNLKAKINIVPYMELILIGVVFVLVLISTINIGKIDGESLKYYKDLGVHIGRGAGLVFAYIGVVAAALPRFFDKFSINISAK